MSDTGTAMLGMIVVRGLRRKIKTTRMTRPTEIDKVNSISRMDARMVVVRSSPTEIFIFPADLGFERGQRGQHAVDRLHDVGAGLPEYDHLDRGLAIQYGRRCGCLPPHR